MRRMRSFLRRIVYIFGVIAILVGLLLMWPLSVAVMNYTGFCFKEWRYLSEKEIIDAAVRYVIINNPSKFEKYDARMKLGRKIAAYVFRERNKLNKYNSVEEFYRVNKNCCVLSDTGVMGYSRTFAGRILADSLNFVRVRYVAKYRDDDGLIKEIEITRYPLVKNCGGAWSGT